MKNKRVNPPYRRFNHSNISQVIFKSLPVSEFLRGSVNWQPCDLNVMQMGSANGFTCIFIPHESIFATCLVTLSAEALGTMSKNNFTGITLKKRPIWGILSITLHLLLLSNTIKKIRKFVLAKK